MTDCKKLTPKQNYAEIGIGENQDYFIDYEEDTLDLVTPSDQLNTSSWTVSGPGTLGVESNDTTRAWTWVTPSGAAKIGNVIRLINTVVTTGGRTHIRHILLKVTNRLAEVPVVEDATFDVL